MDNVLEVSVGFLPGEVKRVAVTDDVETIKDVFELSGFSLEGNYTIQLRGETVSLDDSTDILTNDARLYATKMIKGN